MILITGTSLDKTELPNSDMVEYQIENKNMNIKLKTVAKSPTCFQIYIAEDKRTEYTITDELASKILYFKSDGDLLKMLDSGDSVGEGGDIFAIEPVPEELEPVLEVPSFPEPEPVPVPEPEPEPELVSELEKQPEVVETVGGKGKKTDKKSKLNLEKEDVTEVSKVTIEKDSVENENKSIIPRLNLEVADSELPESFLTIPNIAEDVDSLKIQLDSKNRIISQKEGQLAEKVKEIDDIYKLQEIQLREIQDECNTKLIEAQNTIEELRGKVSNISLEPDVLQFLKFINYAHSSKAVVKEEFDTKEKERLGKLKSNYSLFACGTGESTYSMLKQVKQYISRNTDVVIIDFTNDNFLSSTLKINNKTGHVLSLLQPEINPENIAKEIGKTRVIPTTNFNDIVFLTIDWVELIKKIDEFANGKQVIMLFGNINSFVVRSVISRLSSIASTYVFAKCSPLVLTTLYSDISFFQKGKLTLVALDYINVIKSILDEMSRHISVLAFTGEVEWDKLGLKK